MYVIHAATSRSLVCLPLSLSIIHYASYIYIAASPSLVSLPVSLTLYHTLYIIHMYIHVCVCVCVCVCLCIHVCKPSQTYRGNIWSACHYQRSTPHPHLPPPPPLIHELQRMTTPAKMPQIELLAGRRRLEEGSLVVRRGVGAVGTGGWERWSGGRCCSMEPLRRMCLGTCSRASRTCTGIIDIQRHMHGYYAWIHSIHARIHSIHAWIHRHTETYAWITFSYRHT